MKRVASFNTKRKLNGYKLQNTMKLTAGQSVSYEATDSLTFYASKGDELHEVIAQPGDIVTITAKK